MHYRQFDSRKPGMLECISHHIKRPPLGRLFCCCYCFSFSFVVVAAAVADKNDYAAEQIHLSLNREELFDIPHTCDI